MLQRETPYNPKDLEQGIIRIFTEQLNLDVQDIETDLVDSGILDSLTFVDLLMALEQEYGIAITMDALEIENFRSVRKIAEFIVEQGMVGQKVA